MDQERLTKLEATVENIRDNHLAHMAQDIDRIENKVDKLDNRIWIVLLGVMSILATIVAERLF
jgi:ubiquinone biosynthesis protein UbiJ